MHVRGGLALVLLAAGCYRPSLEPDCAVHCDHLSATPSCPGDLACGGDDRCYSGTVECNQRPIDAGIVDTSRDGTGDATNCFGAFQPFCLQPVPAHDEILAGTFDTDSMCNQPVVTLQGGDVCVFAAQNIQFASTLTVVGSRMLALVAVHDVEVAAGVTIVVTPGAAGANPSVCSSNAGADVSMAGDVGGGAGGTFATVGGNGGAGTSIALTQPPLSAPYLHGGCDGGRGGATAGAGAGAGGRGGGVIELVAGDKVTVLGTIAAVGSGGGGGGGADTGGGGGGGSGGHIVLDAPMITLGGTAQLRADGGGGGGGGDPGSSGGAGVGETGETPDPALPGAARGGQPSNCPKCGAGGNGAFADGPGGSGLATTPPDGPPGVPPGAGGGGGGEGVIRIVSGQSPLLGGFSSPSPTT